MPSGETSQTKIQLCPNQKRGRDAASRAGGKILGASHFALWAPRARRPPDARRASRGLLHRLPAAQRVLAPPRLRGACAAHRPASAPGGERRIRRGGSRWPRSWHWRDGAGVRTFYSFWSWHRFRFDLVSVARTFGFAFLANRCAVAPALPTSSSCSSWPSENTRLVKKACALAACWPTCCGCLLFHCAAMLC